MEKEALAKIRWRDPKTNKLREFILLEGATASIGRSSSNDISIPEQHVSRQHALIKSQDGIFVLYDLDSANGTFVNDLQVPEDGFPLGAGDIIRLYVPTMEFMAVREGDVEAAEKTGSVIAAAVATGHGRIIITNGPREGDVYALQLSRVEIGRATSNARWQIALLDPAVSRPHARLELIEDNVWMIFDLGSSNGTLVNGTPLIEKGRALRDGDVITMGATMLLFRDG